MPSFGFYLVIFSLSIFPFLAIARTSTPTPTATQRKTQQTKSKATTSTSNNKRVNLLTKKPTTTIPHLPKLLPHPDTCYLLEFHHDNCDHAEQMEPVLQRLEEDLDTKVRRININRRKEFFSLLSSVGHDECGSFPFYYNRRTGQAICGATSYSNLRSWGTGEIGHMFHEPPENMHDRESRGAGRKHEVGFKGFFSEKMSRQKAGGGGGKAVKGGTTTKTSKMSKKEEYMSKKKTKDVDENEQKKSMKSANSASQVKSAAASRMEERKARREAKRQTLASAGK